MSRRGRAVAFAALALVCGIASASIATGYRDRVDEQLGETRAVLTLNRSLGPGTSLRAPLLRRAFEVREVPVRFLPPDAIASPAEASGRRTRRPGAGRFLPPRLAAAHRGPAPRSRPPAR